MLAGAVMCLLGVFLLVSVGGDAGSALLLGSFIIGLVLMDVSIDFKRSRALAGIIQKYHRAVKEGGAE